MRGTGCGNSKQKIVPQKQKTRDEKINDIKKHIVRNPKLVNIYKEMYFEIEELIYEGEELNKDEERFWKDRELYDEAISRFEKDERLIQEADDALMQPTDFEEVSNQAAGLMPFGRKHKVYHTICRM